MKKYGYCRISTHKQNIERQVRNIKSKYPDAVIVKEIYTGKKFYGRKEFERILNIVVNGDMIIFDSVSRMSRNAEEGFTLYEELYKKGVTLVFLKEPHINTDTYKQAIMTELPKTGTNVDYILEGINKYLLSLAKEQIRLAFEQSEKEVKELQQRTREGIETARLNGKQIGQVRGRTLVTKKSIEAKEIIKKYNKSFGGQLDNEETMRLAKISKATFYKYKRELERM
ncbi:MAG: recombinase family protein [Lachnospiraceae bacterium]|nr:recombinase family protein [Lachnospiraceae bacterium]